MTTIRFAGTGSYLPPRVLTSRELAKKIRVERSWIEERTGIRERRVAAPGETAAEMGFRAAQAALEAARLAPKDVDCVIASTLSPDRHFPGIAGDIQARLKCGRVPAFDISAQCNGFTFGLQAAAAHVLSGQYRRVLLVSSELHSKYLRFSHANRDLCVLFGDGAGAIVVERAEKKKKSRLAFELHTDGHFAADLCFPRAGMGGQPHMNKTSVIVHSSRSISEVAHSLLKSQGVPLDAVDFIVPHQSNLNLLREVSRRLDCPMSKFVVNIETTGNTSSASIPIALDEAVRTRKIRRGDLLMFLSFGAGFSWGAVLVTY